MKIETQQQQQTGWVMNGRTTPRSAVMDTFRWNAGGGGGGAGGGDVVIRNETKQPRPDKKVLCIKFLLGSMLPMVSMVCA